MRGLAVIKTVLLAVLCLIGLGATVAIKAGTPTLPSNVGASPEQTTVGTAFAQDTLTKADKLEVAYVLDPVAVEPVILVTKAHEETPPQPLSPPATPKIVSRHSHDPNAKKVAAVSLGRRIKGQESKKSKNAERAKLPAELRPCRRPEGIAGLLRVFKPLVRMRHVVGFVGHTLSQAPTATIVRVGLAFDDPSTRRVLN
jgi:hypothetical protein